MNLNLFVQPCQKAKEKKKKTKKRCDQKVRPLRRVKLLPGLLNAVFTALSVNVGRSEGAFFSSLSIRSSGGLVLAFCLEAFKKWQFSHRPSPINLNVLF